MSKNKRPTPGVCRLCGETNKCRDVNIVYEYLGKNEIYFNMLRDCFGIQLVSLDQRGGLVCAPCVIQLRTSCNFKHQVLACEEKLMKRIKGVISNSKSNLNNEKPEYIENDDNILDNTIFCDDTGDNDEIQDSSKTESKTINIAIETVHSDSDNSQTEQREFLVKNIEEQVINRNDKSQDNNWNTRKLCKLKAEKRPVSSEDTKTKQEAIRLWKMKKLQVLRMEKLKAEQSELKKGLAKPLVIFDRKNRNRQGEELKIFQNTVKIVENSYVCPFKNKIGTYYCYYCCSVFRDPEDLRRHSDTHDPKPFSQLWPKKRVIKLDITRIDCRLCEEKITDIPTLKQHLVEAHNIRIHPIENEFLKFRLTYPEIECLECRQSFLFIDRLIKHMTEHFGKYVCDKCGASFIEPSSLEFHVLLHDKPKKQFPCHICGKNLSSNRTRSVHIAVIHEKTPVVKCFHCDEKFFSHEERNKHMFDMHDLNQSVPCAVCGKVFASRRKFSIHNQMVHLKEYKHSCDVCYKKFVTTKQFQRHLKCHET